MFRFASQFAIGSIFLGSGIGALAEEMPSVRDVCVRGQCTVFQVVVRLPAHTASSKEDSLGVIYIGGSANEYSSTVEVSGDACSKEVRVPQPVYETIVDIMKSMSGDRGEPPPVLTPAQQTILLFYSTLMQQTLSFTCSERGGS
jgi:hypothetical protein